MVSANGATRFADESVLDAVMKPAPSARAISKPRSISASVEPVCATGRLWSDCVKVGCSSATRSFLIYNTFSWPVTGRNSPSNIVT